MLYPVCMPTRRANCTAVSISTSPNDGGGSFAGFSAGVANNNATV